MPFLNFTNRINITCNDELRSDIRIYASSLNNKYYVFQENLEKIKSEVKKFFPNINNNEIKIFVEAYRDAYRKEVQWGTLENPITDKIEFFNKKVTEAKDIDRDLDQIDATTSRFRVVMVNGEKNIATSEGFRPFVIKTKDEIKKIEKLVNRSLIGVYEMDMEEMYNNDFHNEAPFYGLPVIYLNKKLGIKDDMNSDSRIRSLIFSSSFKELLRKSFVNPDNKYKNRLLDYAQNFNDRIDWKKLQDELDGSNLSEIYESSDLQEFLDNAAEGYISERNFFEKYLEEKRKMETENFIGEDENEIED